MRYNNYHKHSHYSNIKSIMTKGNVTIVKPEAYMKRAVDLGHTTYCTLETGFQGNVFEALTQCEQYGLQCIVGAEVSVLIDDTAINIILISRNNRGRKLINKLLSQANLNDVKVIATKDMITEDMYDDCFFIISSHQEQLLDWYKLFENHNVMLEITCNRLNNDQRRVNQWQIKVANEHGLKLIHGNCSYFIDESDKQYCNMFADAKNCERFQKEDLLDYPDSDKIIQRYGIIGVSEEIAEQALTNTLLLDECEPCDINKEYKIPKIVEGDSVLELKKIVAKAWTEKKKTIPVEDHKRYEDAIKYEMKIIEDCGMADYFILDHYIVKKAVNEYHGILTRSGRGSAVSFLINHLLGLTEVDRMKSPITLYPTRFMSAERILLSKSLPDIDLNFGASTIDSVIKASKDYLGEDGVYYMVSYKPLQESSAFRLWCKASGFQLSEYDEVAKDLESYVNDRKWSKVIEQSKRFRGVIESVAPSPCSFLLLDKPISEEVGLIQVKDITCCALDGYNCDAWKYLKNDYLCVLVWDLISKTYESIGQPIDTIDTLLSKCNDKVWQLYADGMTTTINQADSDFDKQILKRYKPRSLAELSAYVAGIRPGFASLLDNFVERKPYSTGVSALDDLLEDSFHYLMYQESIMKFLVWLGIEEKETYDIIKKIAKKKFKTSELNALKERLVKQWEERVGTDEGFNATWQVIEDASHYSFNACVSGDTKIQRGSNGNRWHPTVEEMYKTLHNIQWAKDNGHISLHNKYHSKGYGYALSMCEDNRIRENSIVDIRYSGKADIYRVMTESGAYLDCTMNHKFPTPKGKKTLEDLKVGDELYVKGEYEVNKDKYNFTDGNYQSNVPQKGQRGFQKTYGSSYIFNAEMKKHRLNMDSCEICRRPYEESSRFELHHVDFDRTNNNPNNLSWLCCSCHKKEHYKNGRLKKYDKGIPVELSQIVSITWLRNDDVYDIEMTAPNHNFISESGLVTSNSHSLSVAIDSLYGAYLKSNFPLDYFTVALTMYSSDSTRTANLCNELSYFGIKLLPIRYGHSRSTYVMDREKNAIYKGISAVKYCNETIAEELYQLSQENWYDSFVDLLDDIKAKTSVNSKQLSILIHLCFFEMFGKAKRLTEIVKLYDGVNSKLPALRTCKTIKKDKIDGYSVYGISEFLISKYSNKETPKTYSEIDNLGLLNELISTIPDEGFSIRETIRFENEVLGYTEYVNDKIKPTYYVVIDYKTYGEKTRPYFVAYNLSTGESVRTKVTSSKIFKEKPFDEYSILEIEMFTEKHKHKKVNDEWVRTDEIELVVEEYEVLSL